MNHVEVKEPNLRYVESYMITKFELMPVCESFVARFVVHNGQPRQYVL